MRTSLLIAMAAGLVIGPVAFVKSTVAQSLAPVSVEVRLDAARPSGAVAERWGTGVGVGVSAAVRLVPDYALYAGYSRTVFDLDPIDGVRAVDSGFSAGLVRTIPVRGTAVEPWVKGGLLLHSLEIRDGAGAGGDRRPGFEVGAGVVVPSPRMPALRGSLGVGYRRYSARVLGPDREPVTYLAAGAGLILAF